MWQGLCHQIFLKSAKCSLPPKINDRLQNLFCNSNLLTQNVSILMESELGQFVCIQIRCSTLCLQSQERLGLVASISKYARQKVCKQDQWFKSYKAFGLNWVCFMTALLLLNNKSCFEETLLSAWETVFVQSKIAERATKY